MKCIKCGGVMFGDVIMTTEGSLFLLRCITCGRTTDMLSELNRENPPPPPERRGRKPNHVVREMRRKPLKRK